MVFGREPKGEFVTPEVFRDHVARHLAKVTGEAESAFALDRNLVADGLVSSLTFLALLFFIESLTGTPISETELDVGAVDTIGKLHARFCGPNSPA